MNKLLECFKLREVTVTDPYLVNALQKELEYLKAYDLDRLTAGFYETKGFQPKADKYEGWENTEIKGHTMGHYLTAIAQAFETTRQDELLHIMQYLINELMSCQLDSGYLSAFDEVLFDRVENKKPAWVPWYTMHKILSGLVSVYKVTSDPKAFQIMDKLADWVSNRTSLWSAELQKIVLAVEYGGMNDCMYEVYSLTRKQTHFDSAHMFDELPLFRALAEGKDILNNLHANTTIPKFLGALKRVMVTGERDMFFEACTNFWDIVTTHHTYITGGNSEWEHFGEPDILAAERTNFNCETCNTYNMLKLTKGLFQLTQNKKYLDYYENTFLNAILSSQNPETGMTMYFQPMATGYFKIYSTPFENFWCCTGSGMENFTKLNDGIYYKSENSLYVGRYVSSVLKWEEKDLEISCSTSMQSNMGVQFNFDLKNHLSQNLTIYLTTPTWCRGELKVHLTNPLIQINLEKGYYKLTGPFKSGDKISLEIPLELSCECLPDEPNVVAFKYGPIVLSAALGNEDMEQSKTGVEVRIPTKNNSIDDFIVVDSVEEWLKNVDKNMMKKAGELSFVLQHTDKTLVFSPHYKQHQERYGIYWKFFEIDRKKLKLYNEENEKKVQLEARIIDRIPIGNDQYELVHEIHGTETVSDTIDGYRFRELIDRAWISYKMKIDSESNNVLYLKYSKCFTSKFDIYVENILLHNEVNDVKEWLKYVDKFLTIPNEITYGKEQIEVKIVNTGDCSLRIVDQMFIYKE